MRIAISGICILVSGAGAAAGMPVSMTMAHVLDICEERTLESAAEKGNELGWRRLADAETLEWRTNFVAHNGGSVDLASWRHEEAGASSSLSFWIAVGPSGHRACAYSTTQPAELLSTLSKRLGEPDSIEENDAIEMLSVWWTREDRQYSLTQVGSSAIVNVGPSPKE